MIFTNLRNAYHQRICRDIIRITQNKQKTYPNFADSSSKESIAIAWSIAKQIGFQDTQAIQLSGQSSGSLFEEITRIFLQESFEYLKHIRPGRWQYLAQKAISDFEQYAHLKILKTLIQNNPEVASSLGGDYIITPDIVIAREPMSDDELNSKMQLLDDNKKTAAYSPLRRNNTTSPLLFLHASISCKWTIRSDRSQNARTEALNLIRNRKGHVPHIVTITAEPLPTRLASLALGTGDLDCVYHFALPELILAAGEISEGQADILNIMIEGKRLRDISDLPLDLAM